jgi:hypothetical protein
VGEYDWRGLKIHRGHRRWFYFSALIIFAAGLGYGFDYRRGHAAIFGTSGGSPIGLTFGVCAFALTLFAAGRGLRRFLPGGVGTAVFWGRAHVWLGFLVLPLAWFHGGFHHGSTLSSAMMWLLYVIVVSGVMGAVLRYYLSQPSSGGLPEELIDMPIDQAVVKLGAQAAEVLARCEQMALRNEKGVEGRGAAVATLTPVAVAPRVRMEALRELYGRSIAPYLSPAGESGILANHMRAVQMFRRCRSLVSQEFIAPLAELERICDTCRGLRSRQKLGLWVDRLMLVHVPLSTALIILGAIHAIGSMRY